MDDFEAEDKSKSTNKTTICLPYDNKDIYPFWCSRYGNIKYEEYLKIGYEEFCMKVCSIPETEPLYKIIKSRSVDLAKIKNKEERKYWRDLKRINAVPDIYKSTEEIDMEIKEELGERKW